MTSLLKKVVYGHTAPSSGHVFKTQVFKGHFHLFFLLNNDNDINSFFKTQLFISSHIISAILSSHCYCFLTKFKLFNSKDLFLLRQTLEAGGAGMGWR